MSSTLLAVGDSWKTQLRDADGQWIKMGMRVSWFQNGKQFTGETISSPSPNMVKVWPDGADAVILPAADLTVLDPVGPPPPPLPPPSPQVDMPPMAPGTHSVSVPPSAGAEVIADNGGVLDTDNGRAYFGRRFGPVVTTETAAVAAKVQAAAAVNVQMDQFTADQWLAFDKDVFKGQIFPLGGEFTQPEEFQPHAIRMLIGQWAASASDNQASSLALQEAARREFGLSDWKADITSDKQAEIDAMLARQEPMLRAFVRAQHDATVQQLKADGVKTVRVVRGTSQDIPPGNQMVRLNPMSSFTTFEGTAWEFATNVAGTSGGEFPRVLHVEVPVDRVVGMPGSGVGCLSEFEVVLMGGDYSALVESFESLPLGIPVPKKKKKKAALAAAAGDPGEPIDLDVNGEEDWIKTLRWDLSTDPRDFTQAQLRELSRLPAWEAAPPQIKAALRYGLPPILAAGDSWRWQLRDKNGKWIEMGSEVRYLVRGLYKQGIVVGSPSPGVAKVKENITNLLRDIPSNRLEVVESAARVVERVFDVGEREADLQNNPALRDLVERSKKGDASFIGWGDWLLPDEFGPLRDNVVNLVAARFRTGTIADADAAGALVWDKLEDDIKALGFDDNSGWTLSRSIGIRIVETIHREDKWREASDRSKTEIAPNLNKVKREGLVASAVTAPTAKQILTDGRFKSQFEVTSSGGMYDPILRSKYETAMFGVHPQMERQQRAIYGYIYTPGHEDSETLDQYGANIRILLKPIVRSRTTFTAGDSLGTGALPVPLEGPDLSDKEAYMATSAMPRSIGLAAANPDVFQDRDYYEAQIHGGITLDDIQEILITPQHMDYYTQRDVDEIIKLAQQRGIPVRDNGPPREPVSPPREMRKWY